MTPHGEWMCALIDFMLAIVSISIKAFTVESFTTADVLIVILMCFKCPISTQIVSARTLTNNSTICSVLTCMYSGDCCAERACAIPYRYVPYGLF